MRIAAMAAGAVGGYFGARMAAAGHDVFFIARGANLAAIKNNGLQIESVHGDLHLPKSTSPTIPTASARSTSCCSRSSCGTPRRPPNRRRPLVGPNTRVITLQNGVDSVERVAPILGAEQTVGGVAYIASVIAAPGVIKQTSSFAQMRFGHADKRPDAVLQAFVDAGKAAKIDIDISADIERERWQKFIFLTAMAGSTAALRSPIGPIRADPELRGFFRAADGRSLRRRQRQGRRARSRLSRQPHGLSDEQGRARHEGLDGARSRTRQPPRTRLARRQGARSSAVSSSIPTPASDTVYTVLKLHRMGSQH